MIQSLAKHYDFAVDTPFFRLPEKVREVILFGSKKEAIEFSYLGENGKSFKRSHAFEGIIPNWERRYRETDSVAVKEELAMALAHRSCPECHGARLRKEARFVQVGGAFLHEINAMPLSKTLDFFNKIQLDGNKAKIAEKVLKEIRDRLKFLIDVGLNYLTLSRSAETLSGGESQRIRLASQIGSGLTGVMYVLDEPSIGLHQRDNDRLLGTLKHLRDLGNTVIVVEHDEDAIRAADFVVDMGPAAGEHGGEVVVSGSPQDIMNCKQSPTGDYLSGRKTIAVPAKRHKIDKNKMLVITGARGNNLKNITLNLPLGVITCVTGVSGSGKSTLINETLANIANRELNRANT